MKRPRTFSLVLLSVLAAHHGVSAALAQTYYEKGPSSTFNTGEHNPARVQEAEWSVRRLQQALHADPTNEKVRISLVQTLEALAAYHEKKRNSLDAWRYYEAAARELGLSAERKKWKKRIEYDENRAGFNHQLRADFLHKQKRVGFVYTTFQWLDYPKLDRKDALAYTAKVNTMVRDAWSDYQKNSRIIGGGGLPRMLVVGFNLHRDGRISNLKVESSCGFPAVDAAAVRCIRDVGRMPPLLPAMGESVPFQSQFTK
ncbi:MAG: TonB family protein [Cyanobacteria bacterium SZAS TMP-1]|nr:TonB family protein [Cyanobacteria bacterium SZAS TMP-1]